MSNLKRKCKFVKNILNNPKNVKFEEVDKLLKTFGYEVKSKGGSHFVYRKKNVYPITVPYKRGSIKEIYVKQIIRQLKLEEFYEKNCEQRD